MSTSLKPASAPATGRRAALWRSPPDEARQKLQNFYACQPGRLFRAMPYVRATDAGLYDRPIEF
jgi:hypothetical protein